jgi:hypothetical protein
MPSTGWTLAGTGTSLDTDDVSWTNPGNITADDGTNTTSAVSNKGLITDTLQATNFGLSLPATAIVVGVEARVQKSRADVGDGTSADRVVQLVVGGSIVGDNNGDLVTDWPGSATDVDYGGAADLWGLSLSKAQVEASDFGVVISAEFIDFITGTVAIAVDAIWMNVHYVLPGANRGYIIG